MDSVTLKGDFSAHHTDWDYIATNPRGRNLNKTVTATRDVLLNEPGQNTKMGAWAAENDTSTNLTWISKGLRSRWTVMADIRRGGHLPIKIELMAETKQKQ